MHQSSPISHFNQPGTELDRLPDRSSFLRDFHVLFNRHWHSDIDVAYIHWDNAVISWLDFKDTLWYVGIYRFVLLQMYMYTNIICLPQWISLYIDSTKYFLKVLQVFLPIGTRRQRRHLERCQRCLRCLSYHRVRGLQAGNQQTRHTFGRMSATICDGGFKLQD